MFKVIAVLGIITTVSATVATVVLGMATPSLIIIGVVVTGVNVVSYAMNR